MDESKSELTVKAVCAANPSVYATANVTVLPSAEKHEMISMFDILYSKVKYQMVKTGTAASALSFPKMIKATVNAKGHVIIAVAGWVSDPPYNPSVVGTYYFKPVMGSEYVLLSDAILPTITVAVTNHMPSVHGGSHSRGGRSGGGSGGRIAPVNNSGTDNLPGYQNTDGPIQIVAGAAVQTKPKVVNRTAEISASSVFDIALAEQRATAQKHSEVDISLPSSEIIGQLKSSETDSVNLTVKMI